MNPETLDQTMKEYAETGTTSAPGTGPRTKTIAKKKAATKTTATKPNVASVPRPMSTATPRLPKPTQQQEDEFDRLMAMADPEALSDAMTSKCSSQYTLHSEYALDTIGKY